MLSYDLVEKGASILAQRVSWVHIGNNVVIRSELNYTLRGNIDDVLGIKLVLFALDINGGGIYLVSPQVLSVESCSHR